MKKNPYNKYSRLIDLDDRLIRVTNQQEDCKFLIEVYKSDYYFKIDKFTLKQLIKELETVEKEVIEK